MNIYTAGPMATRPREGPHGWRSGRGCPPHTSSALAPWRVALAERVDALLAAELPTVRVEWLHPELLAAEGQHGTAPEPLEVVAADIDGVREAHLVAAYLAGHGRYGTCAEIGYALGVGVDVVAVERRSTLRRTEPYWFARGAVTLGHGLARVVVCEDDRDPVRVLAELVLASVRAHLRRAVPT